MRVEISTSGSGLAAFPVQPEVSPPFRPGAGVGNEPAGVRWNDKPKTLTSTGGTGHVLETPGDDYTAFFAEPVGGQESAEHRMWAFFGRLWSQAGPAVFPEAVPTDRAEWAGYEARRDDWANRRRGALLRRYREERQEREQRFRQSGMELPPDGAPDFEPAIREFTLGVLRIKGEDFSQRRELLAQADLVQRAIGEAEEQVNAVSQEHLTLIRSVVPLDLDRAATLATSRACFGGSLGLVAWSIESAA